MKKYESSGDIYNEDFLLRWEKSIPPKKLGPRLAKILKELLSQDFHSLLEDISNGYSQPENELRWKIFEQAKLIGFSTSAGTLALAFFWSTGSMSPIGLTPVYPDPELSSKMLHCVVIMCCCLLSENPLDGIEKLLSHPAMQEES